MPSILFKYNWLLETLRAGLAAEEAKLNASPPKEAEAKAKRRPGRPRTSADYMDVGAFIDERYEERGGRRGQKQLAIYDAQEKYEISRGKAWDLYREYKKAKQS
jgi:hypothetical protein